MNEDLLPKGWTDISQGANRRQVDNLFDALSYGSDITVYKDGEPAAVLMPVDRYLAMVERLETSHGR